VKKKRSVLLQLNLAHVSLSRRQSSCRLLTARPPHTLGWRGPMEREGSPGVCAQRHIATAIEKVRSRWLLFDPHPFNSYTHTKPH